MCKAIFKLSEGYHPREQIKKWVKVLEAGFPLWEEGECKYRMGKGKGYLMWTDRTWSGSVTAKAGMSAGTRMRLCRGIYAHTQCMYVYSKHTDAHVPELCVYGFTYVYMHAVS